MTIYDIRNTVTSFNAVKIIDEDSDRVTFEGTYGNVPLAYVDCDIHRIYVDDNILAISIDTRDEL